MPQTKILVDTCSYFRLAQNVHPLLSNPFGKAEYTLYPHKALKLEFLRESRLRTKFDWFTRAELVANRSRPIQIGKKEATEIAFNLGYMWEHVKAENLGPSAVDVQILATAAVLGARLVSDDQDLTEMAGMYGVYAMTSLELLRLMLDEGHIAMEKVRQVVAQWQYDRDTPARFESEYRERFGEAPPEE